jgi:hypothetical protein
MVARIVHYGTRYGTSAAIVHQKYECRLDIFLLLTLALELLAVPFDSKLCCTTLDLEGQQQGRSFPPSLQEELCCCYRRFSAAKRSVPPARLGQSVRRRDR